MRCLIYDACGSSPNAEGKENEKKKMRRVGNGSCAPAYETFVFTVKRQRRSPKRKRDL